MKTATFEQYLDRMKVPVKRVARRRSRVHPYLGEEDLFQEALLALWTVWNKHRRKLPFENLCKVGWRAAMRKMITQKDRANSRGERLAFFVDLNGPLMIKSLVFKDGRYVNRGNPSEYDHDKVFAEFAVEAIDSTLSDVGKSLLGEMLQPGEETLRAVSKLWTNRSSRFTPFWRMEPRVYSKSLGVPVDVVRGTLAEIRWKFEAYLKNDGLPIVKGHANGRNLRIGGLKMVDGEKSFVTDPLDFEGADPEEPVEGAVEPETVVDLDEKDLGLNGGFGGEEVEEKTEEEAKEPTPEVKAKPTRTETARPKVEAKVDSKTKPKVKVEKAAAPKGKKPSPKAKVKIVRAISSNSQFREGTQAAKVWSILEKRLDSGKNIARTDVIKAYERGCRMEHDKALRSSSLFLWDLLRKDLIKRVSRGEFSKKKKR